MGPEDIVVVVVVVPVVLTILQKSRMGKKPHLQVLYEKKIRVLVGKKISIGQQCSPRK